MKQVFFLFFAALLFAYSNHSFAQCTGDIILLTQEEVDAFPTDYGCSVIEGSLTIGKYTTNLDINDLSPLENITSIEGNLIIEHNDALTNLDGLQNINAIQGDLEIAHNDALTNLDELQNINAIGEKLEIGSNDALTNLDGLLNINSIGTKLNIWGNDALSSLNGLQNINAIGGNLQLWGNPGLTNLNGLQNINAIQGKLAIQTNNALINLDGLQNINAIQGDLEISNNDALTNLEALQNINTIGIDLEIYNNAALTNLNGLQNINAIGGNLYIYNSAFINLNGLQNINTIGGNLGMWGNAALTNLEALQNIDVIQGDLYIMDNAVLSNLTGLQNINSIGGDLYIKENANLETCCDILPALQGFEGNITIFDNLPSCNSAEMIVFLCSALYKIQAIAFFDENENSIFDSNEQSIQQSFNLDPYAFYSFTDQSGVAHLYPEYFGEYELSLNNINPLWEFTGTNNPVQISFIDSTFSDSLYYFPMIPVADFVIQSVDLSSSITRCNQNTNYWLTYTNEGTTINDGYVELIPSNLTTFVSANPPADSTAGDKLYWFYEDLYPTHSQQIHLVYEMPNLSAIGEQIAFEANIETNEGFGEHKAILSSELICAYDPNDKLVTPFGYGDENYTLFGDTLEYTVRFQNTGNDTAFTVIIEDQLSEFLDLNTFRPIASSHNVETIIDANTRLATFTFNDIYLPDSFVNEPGSHGFVKYQILGNENLSENTDIKNTASIFFDANPPIVTNTVNNRLVSELPALAILTASTDELNFGEIALDEASYVPQMLVIENPGDLTLHIQQFYFENPDFNAGENLSISVEGQSSVEVPIYFAPGEAGNHQGQLTLQSNVGQVTIDLSGSAVLGTSINSVQTNTVKLFPNPNEGQFYLSAQQPIQGYQIQNSLGEIVLEQSLQNTTTARIDLNGQAKGIYFVSVQTAEGMIIQKFLVQ